MPSKKSKLKSQGAKYHTSYAGPTDTKGSRIIVLTVATGKRKIVPYDYAARDAHQAALETVAGSAAANLMRIDDGGSGYYWK